MFLGFLAGVFRNSHVHGNHPRTHDHTAHHGPFHKHANVTEVYAEVSTFSPFLDSSGMLGF